MKLFYLLSLFFYFCYPAQAQISIGTTTPHPSAQLEVASPEKGILIPRVTLAGRPGSPGKPVPVAGLLIYQTDNDPGFYYYNGTQWDKLSPQSERKPTLYGQASLTVSPATADLTVPFTTEVPSPDFVYDSAAKGYRATRGGIYQVFYSLMIDVSREGTFTTSLWKDAVSDPTSASTGYRSDLASTTPPPFSGMSIMEVTAGQLISLHVSTTLAVNMYNYSLTSVRLTITRLN